MRYENRNKGFSISELLMAVLIISLLCVAMGGGVVVVKNAYEKITLRADAQTLLSTTVTKVADELRFARDIQNINTETSAAGVSDAETKTTFLSGTRGVRVSLVNDGDRGVSLQSETDSAQKTPLLTEKTMVGGLVPSVSYTYADGIFDVTVTISRGEDKILTQGMRIRPIN